MTKFSFSCNVGPYTHFVSDDDATAVFKDRLFGIARGQYVLVTGPCGAVRGRERVRVRVRSPGGAFPDLYPSTVLQWIALRSRFALDTQESTETDGFGQLSEQRVDDG